MSLFPPPVLHEADVHDHRGVDGCRHHGRRHVGEVQSARVQTLPGRSIR